MNEFEGRLRLELRSDQAPPDDAFVARVEKKIAKRERRRVAGLVVVSLAFAALGGAMAAGLILFASQWAILIGQLPVLFPRPVLGLMSPAAVIALGLVFMALVVLPISQSSR